MDQGSDIVEGVGLAKENGWQVAVRSGGHSWAAWSLRPGSLLIDLGNFKEMAYHAETCVVSATTSVKRGEELDPFLEQHGRFFNGGHCPTVGIGGFLLQGGQGWNCRGWGWAAESILALDVVTADGELVRADATSNSDLYWAARGAGPAFPGVVVRYHLQTRERFKHVAFSAQLYPVEIFDEVMTWMYSIHESVSADVEIVVVSMTPPAEGDEPRERVIAVTGVALVDSDEEAVEALAPFLTCPVLNQAIVVVHAEPRS